MKMFGQHDLKFNILYLHWWKICQCYREVSENSLQFPLQAAERRSCILFQLLFLFSWSVFIRKFQWSLVECLHTHISQKRVIIWFACIKYTSRFLLKFIQSQEFSVLTWWKTLYEIKFYAPRWLQFSIKIWPTQSPSKFLFQINFND